MTKKHALIMVACCLVPMAAFALISIFKVPVSSLLTIGLVLLCPLSHLLMMKFMPHGHEENHVQVVQVQAAGDKTSNLPATHLHH